jgi:hypothetical protein
MYVKDMGLPSSQQIFSMVLFYLFCFIEPFKNFVATMAIPYP